MTDTPADWEEAEVPDGFVDPRDNPDLPFITHHDGQDDPVPPADRIAAAESGQETRAAARGHYSEADL